HPVLAVLQQPHPEDAVAGATHTADPDRLRGHAQLRVLDRPGRGLTSWRWRAGHAAALCTMAKLTLPTGPAPVATGVTVAGRFTWTGTSLLTVLALPSSPSSLRPQASTCPLLVRARLWLQPALTSVAMVSCGSPAMTGTSLSWVLSLPSCPSALNPQASTWP